MPNATERQSTPLIVIGAGGLGTEYVWTAIEVNAAAELRGDPAPWSFLGYVDEDPRKRGTRIHGHPVHGSIAETAEDFAGLEIGFVVAVGDNAARERLAGLAEDAGWRAVSLIHPSVIVADNVGIGPGTYVGAGCVICPRARLGRHVIVNVHASLGHDSVIGDFAQICPGDG